MQKLREEKSKQNNHKDASKMSVTCSLFIFWLSEWT